jgi:hypothetical protein
MHKPLFTKQPLIAITPEVDFGLFRVYFQNAQEFFVGIGVEEAGHLLV